VSTHRRMRRQSRNAQPRLRDSTRSSHRAYAGRAPTPHPAPLPHGSTPHDSRRRAGFSSGQRLFRVRTATVRSSSAEPRLADLLPRGRQGRRLGFARPDPRNSGEHPGHRPGRRPREGRPGPTAHALVLDRAGAGPRRPRHLPLHRTPPTGGCVVFGERKAKLPGPGHARHRDARRPDPAHPRIGLEVERTS
jgi:hypothetical protein